LRRVIDQVEAINNDDAIAWAHRLMREEGMLAGISCGAAMAAAESFDQAGVDRLCRALYVSRAAIFVEHPFDPSRFVPARVSGNPPTRG